MFTPLFLCHVKGEVPINSAGEVDLHLLNNLDWSLLPIQNLWPYIRDKASVQALLPEHCSYLRLDQILWIAENDPEHREILLKNVDCMLEVNWNGLELEAYLDLLPELPVYSISDLNVISEEIIVDGLIIHNFAFPDTKTLCHFLERLPLYVLSNPSILSNPSAINLFSVDCFVSSEFLVVPLSTFFFKVQRPYDSAWRLQLYKLFDYLKTFPKTDTLELLVKCEVILQDMELEAFYFPEIEASPISNALQKRDPSFFKSLVSNLDSLKANHYFGPFDQYRLLLTLLTPEISEHFSIFIAFYEGGFFEDWLLRKFFFNDHPEITTLIHSMSPELITNVSLLRFFALKQEKVTQHSRSMSTQLPEFKPVLVPMVKDIKSTDDLLDALFCLFSTHLSIFTQSSFRIKYANDAVIDLGGPLLDWITGILRLYVSFGLFSDSVEAEALTFLEPEFFRYLGLLHGKLLQIGSGPTWIPVIRDQILENVAALASLHSDPAEAVRLFNDFEFPHLNLQKPGRFRVCSQAEIRPYLFRLKRLFATWKSIALHEYQAGLDHFLLAQVPQNFVKCLLQPQAAPTATRIAQLSLIEFPSSIPCTAWNRVLESLSLEELLKFLIFTTGQCHPVPITVTIVNSVESRLPYAQTCSRELTLYLPNAVPTDEDSIVQHLSCSLKTAIHNYEGFGNS